MAKQIDNTSIFDRFKDIVPPAENIATSLQVEHQDAARLHRLAILFHAAKVEALEAAHQAVTDSADFAEAMGTLVTNQRVNMEQVDVFMDKQSAAQIVIRNMLEVYVQFDPPTIKIILDLVNLPDVTRAGREMKLSRVAELIDALLSATEGR